ncbi:response regulator transcription factor [Virgibacillus salarius]|uniref:response regulator transcription factor n=1 Tax=Virgibacillus salarius TaxID=447199 RepID=UPI003CD0CB3B
MGILFKSTRAKVHPLYGIQLTKRELNILTLLAEGYDNRQMGENLHLSEHTVRDYVSSLMGKLKARNRTQVVSTGFRLGLLK